MLQRPTVWNDSCQFNGVLRITVITEATEVVLKLEGRLAGPWVDELRKTVLLTDAWRRPLQIDVSGLTFAEDDGEEALCWLHKMGARFQGKGPFPEYLFERLQIPLLQEGTVIDVRKTSAESRTPGMPPKRTEAKRKR